MFIFYRENARWLLGGFLLALFSGFGQTFYISIWGAEIRETFSLSHGEFGQVYMVATLASAATLPFLGRIVDLISVAKTSLIVISVLAVACAMMGVINSVALLIFNIYLLRLFGQGMMTHTAMTAMGRWYSANRGKAVSAASIGHQFSEGIFPSVFVAIAALIGWRYSWFAASAVLIVVALPVILLLMRVERVPLAKVSSDHKPLETGRQWTRAEMLRDSLFWLTCIGVFSPAFIGTSIFFHQDYLVETNGWEPQLYYTSFALMAMTTVVVSLLTGLAIDRWSAVQVLPFFLVPLSCACFVLGSFSQPAMIFVFMVLLGFSYGISSPLFGAIWPETYGTRHLGSVRAVTVSMMVFMSAAGPGVTGVLIDLGIPFQTQLIAIGFFCIGAVVLMSLASRLYQRRLELKYEAPA
ncbi:MAG: MFS transporter [Pseudomonadota bacterium]